MVKVKICGIRTLDEAMMCVEEGSDGLGFICGVRYKAEDATEIDTIRKIVKNLPPYVTTVFVTHLEDVGELKGLFRFSLCQVLQIQGDMSPENVVKLRNFFPFAKFVKAVHVNRENPLEYAKRYEETVDALLLDTMTEDRIGGTGIPCDWNICRFIRKSVSKPVILAGGLSPENVLEALEVVRPYGVDANSKLDDPEGMKDRKKVREFIKKVRSWIGPF